MERPFAPSPRRRALARAAGLVLASPAWTAAFAIAAAALAIAATAVTTAGVLTERTRAALAGATAGDPVAHATTGGASPWVAAILAAAAPVLLAAAAGAIAAAAALARGLFIPRRNLRGAPTVPAAPAADAALTVARTAALAAVAAVFVITQLPGLANLATVSPTSLGLALRGLVLAALAHLAAAAAVLAAVDAVVRHQRLAASMRMTAREARDDAREAGHDPNRRRRLRDARAADPRDRLRDAAALVVGSDAVVAIRWSPGTLPTILLTARGLPGRALLAAARHHRVPAVADDDLAETLAAIRGPLPAAHHAALARVLAA